MAQVHSDGLEVANTVVSSGILRLLCNKISELESEINQNDSPSVTWKFYEESNCIILTFVTSSSVTNQCLQNREFSSSSSLPHFQFLCTKVDPPFSMHEAAVTLFNYVKENIKFKDDNSDKLKDKHNKNELSHPLIITGHSLGGSVAALFTLWLVEGINEPGAKRPLCITFGAPLIGDEALQKTMSHNPLANSCFLHVAADNDVVPRLFLRGRPPRNPDDMDIDSQTQTGTYYKPFATFLLCSDSGYTCVEDSEEVCDLLEAMGVESVGNQWQMNDYKKLVERLMSSVHIKGTSEFGQVNGEPLRVGILLQLEAIGVKITEQNSGLYDRLIKKLEDMKNDRSRKKEVFDPSKKLNEIKIKMAYMEWYKKSCKSAGKGYYDSYKGQNLPQDMDVVRHKKYLEIFWNQMVAEAEKKPQTAEAAFRTRYLYGGTTYRRMIEPLAIAEFYKEGKRGYVENGRSDHYKQLENWLNKASANVSLDQLNTESSSSKINAKKEKVAEILTEDSCFWAHVEEALIDCESIKNANGHQHIEKAARDRLKEFEDYVTKEIDKYAVSPEIFLGGSSFMQWWEEYKGIIPSATSSRLIEFMTREHYKQYANGSWSPAN